MFDTELLFRENTETSNVRWNIKNGRVIIPFKRQRIDGKAIRQLLKIVNTIEKKFAGSKIPLTIDMGDVVFADKLTLVIFECICFYIITICKRTVYLQYLISQNDIWTEGVRSAPFLLLGTHNKEHTDKFIKKFKFEAFGNHFRKIIGPSEDKMELSKLMTEIELFLRLFSVGEDCRDKISEVIVELVGNAGEHAKTESLLDVDVTFPYTNSRTGEDVYGINIVILNFSHRLFGTALKEKLHSDHTPEMRNSLRYHTVLNAYENHAKQFNDWYGEEDFYNIASFQHKISGREDALLYGGTGLTKLIESLEKMSDAHHCYMLTGCRVINFISEHLLYGNDEWISFNGSKDFFDNIPDKSVISGCPVYFPGTAYNLNFVMKKETENGSKN